MSNRTKTKPTARQTGPGRPAVPGLDRRRSRTITLPDSLWQRLDHVTAASGVGTISALCETLLTTKSHV